MIISQLKGGLGNQMFQYALGRKLSLQNNKVLILDLSYVKKDSLRNYELVNLNIQAETSTKNQEQLFAKANKLQRFLPFYQLISEKSKRAADHKFAATAGFTYLDGYWQSEEYFKDIRKQLIKDFQLKKPLDRASKKTLNLISKHNSVAVHSRRTDYVTNTAANKVHGVCSLAYYKKAIKYITKKIQEPHFFIFSDDINWVKNNLKLNNCFYMDKNPIEKGFKDLELMKNCKHFITANSSFSWWGAWLSENQNKIVVAPKPWFAKKSLNEGDTVPIQWIRIDTN